MKKRIAIPVDGNDMLDAHFGHCRFFRIMDVRDNSIESSEQVVPPPHEPGLLPAWLAEKGVTDIIAGGMGQRAITLFNQNNINVFVGAPRLNSDELLQGFLNKSLSFSANYCDH